MTRYRVTIRSEVVLEEVYEAPNEERALELGREEVNMSGLAVVKEFEAHAQQEDEEDAQR